MEPERKPLSQDDIDREGASASSRSSFSVGSLLVSMMTAVLIVAFFCLLAGIAWEIGHDAFHAGQDIANWVTGS